MKLVIKSLTALALSATIAGAEGVIQENALGNNTNYENSTTNNTYEAAESFQDTTHTQTNNSNTTHSQRIHTNQASAAVVSNLTTSGQDTCFGSETTGIAGGGFGISNGKTIIDDNCVLIKQSKLLASLGLKDAAILLLINADPAMKTAIAGAYPDLAKHLGVWIEPK